jgi:hypothetical protein
MKKNTINEVVMGAPLDRMPSKINHGFGEKRSYEVHPGVDLATPSGTPVKAPMDGEVVNVNNNGHLCGGTIDIDYKNGFWSRFCHIKRIDVGKGQVVKAGQVIGLSGGDRNDPQRGNSKGAHLHFTLKKDGKLVDPMLYINKFDVGTSEFPMSGATPSMDKTGWDDFFSKDGISSAAAAKAPKLDPLLKSILSPLEKALNIKMETVEFVETLSESLSLEGGRLKAKNIFSVKPGMNMICPEEGKVLNISDSKECSRGILIKHSVDNQDYYSKFCNVRPKVTQGELVPKGRSVGVANENATIQIFDKKQKAINLTNFVNTEDDKDLSGDTKKKEKKKIQSMDPLLNLALSPLKLLNLPDLDMKSTTSSGSTEPFKAVKWLKSNSLTKNESVDRDIKQIKKLL